MGRTKTSAMAMIAILLGAAGLGAGAYSVNLVRTGAVKGDDGDDGDDGIVQYVEYKEDIIPRALVYATTDQNADYLAIRISFQDEEYDTMNAYDLGTNIYTIPSDGYYYIQASITIDDTDASAMYCVYLYVLHSGSPYVGAAVYETASSNDYLTITLTTILFLNQSDEIHIRTSCEQPYSYIVVHEVWARPCCTFFLIEKRT